MNNPQAPEIDWTAPVFLLRSTLDIVPLAFVPYRRRRALLPARGGTVVELNHILPG